MSNHTSNLGTERIGKLLFKLSVPAMFGMFIMAFYNFVDSIFIGRFIGADALAGVILAIPAQVIVSSVALMVGIGASSVISRKLGEDNFKHAEKILSVAFTLSIIFGTIFLFIFTIFGSKLLTLFSPGSSILSYAKTYLFTISFGFIFINISMLLNNVARSEGRAKVAMLTMVISSVLNIILDYVFILHLNMGTFGAALATVISQFVASIYLLLFFFTKKSTIHLKFSFTKIDMPAIKEIFVIGFPTFVRQVSFALQMIVFNKVLLIYGGAVALASLGIVNRIHMMIFMPIYGLVQGLMPISGFNYGAKKFARVTQVFWLAVKSSTIVATILFIIMYFFSTPIVSLFTTDTEVIKLAAFANWFLLLGIFVVGFQMMAGGLFQALGFAKKALLSVSARMLFLIIPLTIILSSIFGLNGSFIAIPIADYLSLILNVFLVIPLLKVLKSKKKN